jgi:hypothetical protein
VLSVRVRHETGLPPEPLEGPKSCGALRSCPCFEFTPAGEWRQAIPMRLVMLHPSEIREVVKCVVKTCASMIVDSRRVGVRITMQLGEMEPNQLVSILPGRNIQFDRRTPVAQLFDTGVDFGEPVSSESYAAVAEVLAFVSQLMGKKMLMPPRAVWPLRKNYVATTPLSRLYCGRSRSVRSTGPSGGGCARWWREKGRSGRGGIRCVRPHIVGSPGGPWSSHRG